MKKIMPILMMIIMSMSAIATCTVTLDEESYDLTETVTANMVCSSFIERSQTYTLTWTNASGATVETDIGVTPLTQGTSFFETYQIPSNYFEVYGDNITATLTGTNLEGTDSATVTNVTGNVLVINNCQFKPKAFIGSDFSVDCEIHDINDKKIDNAHCVVYATNQDGAPLQIAETTSQSINGEFVASGVLKPENMEEDTSYLAEIRCHCETGDNKCWDEGGIDIEKHQGGTAISFLTSQWLDVNTLVDTLDYEARQVARVCANVTNVDGEDRVAMHIYYQVRCGKNNDDTDRVVIAANPESDPDKRGISFNTTQNQCWALIIPEKRWMQGRINTCYASTEVWVLNEHNERIKGYFTTSPTFNITISDLGINADWNYSGTNNEIMTTQVNMSSSKYNDYMPDGRIGNIDLRLDMHTPEYTDPYTDSSTDGLILFKHNVDVQDISSIVVTDCAGSTLSYGLENTNEGFIELEVRDVNQSTACINAVVTLNTYKNRNTLANEGLWDSFRTWLGRLVLG